MADTERKDLSNELEYIVAVEPTVCSGTFLVTCFNVTLKEAEEAAKKLKGTVWILKVEKTIDNRQALLEEYEKELRQKQRDVDRLRKELSENDPTR